MIPRSARRVAVETLAATAASTAALALAARLAGRTGVQPLNATSHWLNGEGAAQRRGAGWRTTGVGLATHLAATAFWATFYEAWLARGRRTPADRIGKALAMAGVAALVDYTATPKRFTPGWEFVLSPRAMAGAYLALALGLAAGAAEVPSGRQGA